MRILALMFDEYKGMPRKMEQNLVEYVSMVRTWRLARILIRFEGEGEQGNDHRSFKLSGAASE